ncbi:MAG: hypothetical protein Q8N23_24210 [Archangium sp.]|nr:hypothetical protein [Archangium sp.]MDP3155799.1 hypothetical protein [Archangium sp.]MDP3574173.1 hypothetical protein [Archangium sp.]
MAMKPSGVVGGTLSTDPSAGVVKPAVPSAVNVAMANRQFAALRGQKADERADEKRAQEAQTRGAVARRVRKSPRARQLVTRERVLELLSDDEVARVCTAEATAQLAEGEEYLDLAHLELGVRRGGATPMTRVLPRQAIDATTWARIVAQLSSSRRPAEARP